MAVTVADVANPNGAQTELSAFAPFRARFIDVTFDNSYVTTGEPLTTAMLGWNVLFGAIPLGLASNAAGTLSMPVVVKSNAAQSQLTLQLQRYDGASAGKASLEEAANAFDASLFTVRLLVLGA